jgi:hypothetical protein
MRPARGKLLPHMIFDFIRRIATQALCGDPLRFRDRDGGERSARADRSCHAKVNCAKPASMTL